MAVRLTGRTTLTNLAKFGLDLLEGLGVQWSRTYCGRGIFDPERLQSYLLRRDTTILSHSIARC